MGAAVAWSWLERYGGTGVAGLVTLDMSPRPVNGEGWTLGLLGRPRNDYAGTPTRSVTIGPSLPRRSR